MRGEEQYIIWLAFVAKKTQNLRVVIARNCSFDFHVDSYIVSTRINENRSFPPKFTDGRN